MSWRCDDVGRDQEPLAFKIDYEHGALQVDTTAFRGSSYLSLTSPNDMYVGVYSADGAPVETLLEQSVTLRLNGKVGGYGCYERTVFGVITPEP
jgi:hypothetical protein